MWIVNLALRRPYTFIVLSIFILIAGVLSILSTPKDIFPSINIPVISVIWTFTGMAPEEVEQHITSPYERVLTTTVDIIERHRGSQNLPATKRQRTGGNSTGHLSFSGGSQTASEWHYSAAGAELQRHERASDQRRTEQ